MPFKPFAHLARVSLAKGIAHNYGPSVVAAGQSSYTTTTSSINQFQNLGTQKFAKATHLQATFAGPSSSGAGPKFGHASQNSGGDAGLAQYYAAWQHAQQTGDDTDWRQHQFARRIGWKSQEKSSSLQKGQRLDSKAIDLLRPSARTTTGRPYNENAAHEITQAQDSLTEAEALAKVDEAIRQEIRNVNDALAAGLDRSNAVDQTPAAVPETASASEGSVQVSSPEQTAYTSFTSTSIDDTTTLSQRIIELGEEQQYVEIPAVFELMLKEGLTPTVEAYNYILASAIQLGAGTYQAWPRALEIYSDMTRRNVVPNASTYRTLIQFLSYRSLEASSKQKSLAVRQARYGSADGTFVFKSTEVEHELFSGDNSVIFATKLYNVAKATFSDFTLSSSMYDALVEACAQQGRVDDMNTILSDMRDQQLAPASRLYTVIINAYADAKDIPGAKSAYEQYRDLAIRRGTNDPQDFAVYAGLIRAYFACGFEDAGHHFYAKIMQSYENAEDRQMLSQELTASVATDAIVQHHIDSGDFADAIRSTSMYDMTIATKDQALSKISAAAADASDAANAESAFASITSDVARVEPAMALVAMHIRSNNLDQAQAVWQQITAIPNTAATMDFVAMYVSALIRNGRLDEGLMEARKMFDLVRASYTNANAWHRTGEQIDEAIVLFGGLISQQQAVLTAQTSICLIRTMIENGGLVSPVAEYAIASLGPDCIFQLNNQDIALALHVQAGMLPAQPGVSDPAHAARFCHLLETVLNRTVPMDPSTVTMVTEALPRLHGARPDLVQRWQEYLRPVVKPQLLPPFSPAVPTTPVVEAVSPTDAYDPYAYNTDYRASTIISDLLDSTTGRMENHLSEALGRFKNVRRAGRHVRYNTYAKLITAAGKTRQSSLIQEIFGMAQSDVPFLPEYPSVKAGWVPIYDAMVAAALTVGDRKLAAKYHRDLLDMGAAPSANTFGIYITTLEGTFDEATEAVRIFQRALSEGVEPTVFLYNAVIGKLGKARRIDDCLFYFGDMQAKNIRPSSVTYGTLVNALCRTSEERFAEEMFDEMESMPNYRPRAAPYNCLIQYFLNTKRDRTKVLSYYERMKARRIAPTSHTYKLLIEAHATLEPVSLEAAESILQEMKASSVRPEAVHYGTLIHAKGCVMHDMEGARKTFDSVLADPSIRVTDNLYQNLLEAMVANHQVAQTGEILEDMKMRRVAMTPYIANSLIHGWAQAGDVAKATEIYDGLGWEKREPSTYEAMTRAYLSNGDKASAAAVVKEMLRKGYPTAVADKICALVGSV